MDSIFLSNANKTYDLVLLSHRWQIVIVVLYTTTSCLSFFSNVLAIFILLSNDRLTGSELWKYLVNLSIADILMALNIPFTYTSFMLGQWIFPPWTCSIIEATQLCSVFVSVYTLIVIGFDRYFAIVHPFHTLIYLKTHKSRALILIWIIGIIFSSIQMMKTQAVPFINGNETYYDCRETWDDKEGQYYTIFVFILTFGFPVFILTFVYFSIGMHIMRRTTPGNPDIARDNVQWNLKIKVIKMLVTIVILFCLCWLPIHVHTFFVWFSPPDISTYHGYMTYVISFFVCHWLAMSHSFLNPIIYSFMSENFKISFRKLFCNRSCNDNRFEIELDKMSNMTNITSTRFESPSVLTTRTAKKI